jgi:catechol 2,3-dioxygenase-like lactoylglutathione lyase family enzyme
VEVQFIASVSVIAPEPAASRRLFVEALGLPLERLDGEYFANERIEGSKHFGVWPLAEAAQACFGTEAWPPDRPVPQASIEFELAGPDAVADGAAELEGRGFGLLHGARTEPWGQTVARHQTVEGLVVELSYAPWLH